MKEIKRDVYLEKLINRKENGLIKIVTGIRRCGKSYLLDPIFLFVIKRIKDTIIFLVKILLQMN